MHIRFAFSPLLALALASTALSGTVSAQDMGDFAVADDGTRTFSGSVTSGAVTVRYPLPADSAIRIDVVPARGSEIDPVLLVKDAATGAVLAEDDDGGEDLASRAQIYSETARDLVMEVTTFAMLGGDEAGGAFEIRVSDSDFRPQPVTPLAYGSEVSGSLAEGETRGFTVTGRRGEVLDAVALAQGEFDPVLVLYPGDTPIGEPIASDDDGAGALNARLRHVFTEDGEYLLVVSGVGESAGDFTLRAAPVTSPAPQAPQQQLALGETASGRLGMTGTEDGFDPSAITYRLTEGAIAAIRGGQTTLTIAMRVPETDSAGFPSGLDPLLEVGFETPLGYATAMSDDDGGGNLDSLVRIDLGPLAREGDWLERLRIRAASIAGAGEYELTASAGR